MTYVLFFNSLAKPNMLAGDWNGSDVYLNKYIIGLIPAGEYRRQDCFDCEINVKFATENLEEAIEYFRKIQEKINEL